MQAAGVEIHIGCSEVQLRQILFVLICIAECALTRNWIVLKIVGSLAFFKHDTTASTASLRQMTPGQLNHSAAENCLCKKLTETQWGY